MGDFDTGEHLCDISMKPIDVAPDRDGEDPFDEDAPSRGGDALDENNKPMFPDDEGEDDEDDDEELNAENELTIEEIAVEVAHMFDIWPEVAVDVEVDDDLLEDENNAQEVLTAL